MCSTIAPRFGLETDDLEQEVRASLWQKDDFNQSNKGGLTYLWRRIGFVARDLSKRNGATSSAEPTDDDALMANLDATKNDSRWRAESQLRTLSVRTLAGALNVSEQAAQIIAMRVGFDLTLKEIARQLGRTEGAVTRQYHRTMNGVKQALGDPAQVELYSQIVRSRSTGSEDHSEKQMDSEVRDELKRIKTRIEELLEGLSE